MLAHASGEWIASDWPVCPVAETANPQRMGAALTYARRYALFTLVGIAGEDDLDAPDLCEVAPPPPPSAANRVLKPMPDQSRVPSRTPGNGRGRGMTTGEAAAIIDGEQSAALRDRLLAEIGNIGSAELAADWARKALAAKNKLAAPDAKLVEDSFEQRLSELASAGTNPSNDDTPEAIADAAPQEMSTTGSTEPHQSGGIDKSVLAVAAPRRYRNREHLRAVAKQPCLICGRKPSDPHHLRYLQPRALGRKVSDEFAVPLCRVHHRAVHRARDERAWWQAAGIDPIKVARKLWKDTRIDEGKIEPDRAPQAAAADQTSQPGGVQTQTPA
jgi:ERF superfamily